MLEFYPMPTNLNNGGALYSHHHHHHATSHHLQNHGTAARFLDNSTNCNNNNSTPLTMSTASTTGLTSNANSNNMCGQQPQQQQLLQLITSPAYASCPPLPVNTATSGNAASPTSISASATAAATSSLAATVPMTPASATPQLSATATTAATMRLNANNSAALISCNSSSALSPTATASSTPASFSSSSSSSSASTSVSTSMSMSSPSAASTVVNSSSDTTISAAMLSTTISPTAASTQSSLSISVSSALSSSSSASSASKLSADCNGRTEVGHIKCEKIFEICEGCGQKIHDRYLMNIGDTNWHEQCLACCYCGMQLHHTCYVRNTKLYCKLDYDRLFGIKCTACCHPILPQEMVMRPIQNFTFHLTCFICYACRLPLQKGEQFWLRDGQLLCYRHDFDKELFLTAPHCGYMALDEDDLMRPRDGRRGPKRPRTILTSQQRKQFKASFDQSPKPCRKVREALAKDTGLSVRVVQVWFQNQRAKMKKIQRKAKNSGGTSSNSGNNARNADDKDKDKDEKNVKQESASGSESGYLGLDSTFASQPLNPNLPFSPDDYPANSNDSFCSSDLSLDGSNFDQLDDDTDSLSLNNLELQSTGSSGNHAHHHHHHANPHDMIVNLNTSLINPIDKLYLMQNSYFSSEQ